MDANRDDAFDVKASCFSGVLGARLEDDLWPGLDRGGSGAGGLGHLRDDGLAEIDGTSDPGRSWGRCRRLPRA